MTHIYVKIHPINHYYIYYHTMHIHIRHIGERRVADRGRPPVAADADRRLRHRRVYEQAGSYTGQETRAYRYVIVYVCV